MDEKLVLFYESVDGRFLDFVMEITDYLVEKGCKCDIKTAKNGYMVSFIRKDTKRTFANLVTRKSGMKLRIYADHIKEYQSFLDTLPENIKKDIRKSSVCKRLVDPNDCNPRCLMGYTFDMDGETYNKCRYMAFMPSLSEDNNAFIRKFLENELSIG